MPQDKLSRNSKLIVVFSNTRKRAMASWVSVTTRPPKVLDCRKNQRKGYRK